MKQLALSLFTASLSLAIGTLSHAATFTSPYTPSSAYTYLFALSRDGSAIIGVQDYRVPPNQNVHWTAAAGLTSIPDPPNSYSSYVRALSDDGSLVALNTTYFPENRDRAYLWSTSNALVPLAIGDAESNTA